MMGDINFHLNYWIFEGNLKLTTSGSNIALQIPDCLKDRQTEFLRISKGCLMNRRFLLKILWVISLSFHVDGSCREMGFKDFTS